MIPVSGGVALTMFTMCAVLVYFLNYSSRTFADRRFDLNCIVMARNRWLLIRSSMASSPERVGVFSYTSLLPILKHIDSGLSLMITALSSLATKVEEMG